MQKDWRKDATVNIVTKRYCATTMLNLTATNTLQMILKDGAVHTGASLSSPSESYSSSLSPSPARSSASKRSVDDSDASTQGSEDGRARQRTGGADSSSESDTDDDGAGQMRQMRLFTGLAPVEEGEEGAVGVQL